ncbi:class I SAM-dependent methyltransferase [Calidifontibacter terrae]
MTNSIRTAAGSNLSVRRHAFDYLDPAANEKQAVILEELRFLEAMAEGYYGSESGHLRKRRSGIDFANPATARLIAQAPAVEHWLSLVPTAAALDPAYNPDSFCFPGGVPIDEATREWLRNSADGQGIRSRAAVMRKVLLEEVATSTAPTQWLSLACGAAQPVLSTMDETAASGHPVPNVTLADLDKKALRLAVTYAVRHGLADRTQTVRANVLDRQGFGRRGCFPGGSRPSPWLGAFDAVDAVGLLEYLKADDWTYTYNGIIKSRKVLAGAVTFLRNAFSCVKPGGLLLVGNMLDTHPQLGFTMNVLQWPHIQPRSVHEMLTIFGAAGLSGQLNIYLPSDGVYAVYVLRKNADY